MFALFHITSFTLHGSETHEILQGHINQWHLIIRRESHLINFKATPDSSPCHVTLSTMHILGLYYNKQIVMEVSMVTYFQMGMPPSSSSNNELAHRTLSATLKKWDLMLLVAEKNHHLTSPYSAVCSQRKFYCQGNLVST